MTPEAINQAMAELDGYRVKRDDNHGHWPFLMVYPDGSESPTDYSSKDAPWRHEALPKYTEDLNAVARVVGKLSSANRFKYLDILVMALDGIGPDPIDATALQRCEAILRAVGKWVEG